jgi:hypothetical protein
MDVFNGVINSNHIKLIELDKAKMQTNCEQFYKKSNKLTFILYTLLIANLLVAHTNIISILVLVLANVILLFNLF